MISPSTSSWRSSARALRPAPWELAPAAAFLGAALLVALMALSPLSANAGDWKGEETTVEGVLHVNNPAEPMKGEVTVEMKELWRLGGYSDNEDEFFGLIARTASDKDGNLYLLDSQLNEVKIFSPEGEFLRAIGREGEGPGEFRRPSDLFIMNDGTVGVMQLAPGKIVLLSPEGEPAGEHPIPPADGQGFRLIRGCRYAGDHLVLASSVNSFEEGKFMQTHSLTNVDPEGNITKELHSATSTIEFANAVISERGWDLFYNRWDTADDGRVMTVRKFGEYEVTVWNPDGSVDRVINMPHDPRKRTPEEIDRLHKIFEAFVRQIPDAQVDIEEYDSAVNRLYSRSDGSLWVLSSYGSNDLAEGVAGVFDVFDKEGHFVRRVSLVGDGDVLNDGYFFVNDRFYIVTDLLSAAIAAQGGGAEEEEDLEEEPEPMSVIAYELNVDAIGI